VDPPTGEGFRERRGAGLLERRSLELLDYLNADIVGESVGGFATDLSVARSARNWDSYRAARDDRESIPPEQPDVEVCQALADLADCVGDLADAVTDLANEVLRGRWGAHPTYSR
jgi:hypothetical protein